MPLTACGSPTPIGSSIPIARSSAFSALAVGSSTSPVGLQAARLLEEAHQFGGGAFVNLLSPLAVERFRHFAPRVVAGEKDAAIHAQLQRVL